MKEGEKEEKKEKRERTLEKMKKEYDTLILQHKQINSIKHSSSECQLLIWKVKSGTKVKRKEIIERKENWVFFIAFIL